MESLKELDEATEPAFQANDLETARIQFGKISAALINCFLIIIRLSLRSGR